MTGVVPANQQNVETSTSPSYPLSTALNYGYAAGSPHLLRFITEHVELIHAPEYSDWSCALTCGSPSALDIILQILCDPGDCILVEKYTYTGTIQVAKSLGLGMVGVEMDEEGLDPGDLEEKLRCWDESQGMRPGVLYMVPTGQNPTGTTQGRERREEIYEVAERWNLVIAEDDPYYFLQLENPVHKPSLAGIMGDHDAIDAYVNHLPGSYLSLDMAGRVSRLDSFSKIMAPGLGCGWITASEQIINKFLAITEVSTVAPSGVAQVMLYKSLDETWGHLGFVQWLMDLSFNYRQRRDVLVAACEGHVADLNCSWVVPNHGMFLWIRIRPTEQRELTEEELDSVDRRLEAEIFADAQSIGVLISKGSWFLCPGSNLEEICVRLTFAAAPQDALFEAVRRLSNALRAVLECN